MLVHEIMNSPVVTIREDATLADAYDQMQARNIRHLPVVREDRLVGIVTDRDLRLATSRLAEHPFSAEARVQEVMTREVLTASPLDPVEEAARVMRDRKIGCLPVLEGAALVGIITGPDLLDALMRLTGLSRPSGRIAVELGEGAGQFCRLMTVLDEHGVSIHSILSYPDRETSSHVILRVNTINTRGICQALSAAGFNVVWPRTKAWCQ